MSRVPKLSLALVLEAPGRIEDGLGGHHLAWRALGQLWARIEPGNGRERLAQVGPESLVRLKVTTRAYPQGDVRRPVPGQRFRHGARIFPIEAVFECGADGRWLTCVLREEMRS